MPTTSTDAAAARTTTRKLDVESVRELWLSDLYTKDIATQLGVTEAALQSFARRHGFPKRPPNAHKSNAAVSDPTPEEILKRAAEVRAMRSAQEEERMYRYARVELRQYSYNGRSHMFSEM
jgi:hypothetical protein